MYITQESYINLYNIATLSREQVRLSEVNLEIQ